MLKVKSEQATKAQRRLDV